MRASGHSDDALIAPASVCREPALRTLHAGRHTMAVIVRPAPEPRYLERTAEELKLRGYSPTWLWSTGTRWRTRRRCEMLRWW